ncbi:TPA: formate/nitrite transporter family protein, partial [Bacillus anthracis]|nr:formate/nitrite transporter family protein [Bacillus anthracis]
GELITGNMMSMSMALYAKKITFVSVLNNWIWITFMNFVGAIFVAYCFGHLGGLTEGDYLNKTVAIAEGKLHESFGRTLILAIGCNWLVCLALWLAYGTSDFVGKIIGIWIPIMAFVVIGFQQVVANMFVISAVIFAGHLTWMDLARNFVPVFIGNVIGGAGFVGFAYYACYQKQHSNMK